MMGAFTGDVMNYALSNPTPRTNHDSDSNIATANALTLLLHNQHALGAAIEEITKWLSENGVEKVAENAVVAMETLDTNARAITDVIMRVRRFSDSPS
jgi:hypothetical protein